MGRRLISWLVLAAVTAALFEGVCFLAVETGLLVSARPAYGGDGFWRGDDPRFGVWRYPEGVYEHVAPCFRVTYRSNSVGARDVERPEKADQPRVVVLGDSFLDGWGIARAERLSSRLEAATGVAHLNFAMPHFGPYQEALVYRELATRYDHDAVVVGLLPANDFVDTDLDLATRLLGYEYRYRPYLVEGPAVEEPHAAPAGTGDTASERAGTLEPAGYVRFDLREPRWRRFLRTHSYAFNALLRAQQALAADPTAIDASEAQSHSWFYDFEPRHLARLEAILDDIVRQAGDRPVALLLIPTLDDLRRFGTSGPDPLSRHLMAWSAGRVQVVNLLPAMARRDRRWQRYYLACDYHWNAHANAVATRLVRDQLAARFYAPLEEKRTP